MVFGISKNETKWILDIVMRKQQVCEIRHFYVGTLRTLKMNTHTYRIPTEDVLNNSVCWWRLKSYWFFIVKVKISFHFMANCRCAS